MVLAVMRTMQSFAAVESKNSKANHADLAAPAGV